MNRKEALKWLLSLKEQQHLKRSTWPSGLIPEFDALQQSGIIRVTTPPGRRAPHITVIDNTKLDSRIAIYVGDAPQKNMPARTANIHKHGSSKKGKELPYLLMNVLPGSTPWSIGEAQLNLPNGEHQYSGLIIREGEPSPEPTGKVVLIENRESWLKLRSRLPDDLKNASIIHYEGWVSSRLIQVLKGWGKASIWLAPDYDPVGFQNFIKLKEVRQDVHMLLPNLTDKEIEQWGNSELWAKQRDYLYTARNWCAKNPGLVSTFFDKLTHLGLAVEQEFLSGISRLVWDMEQVEWRNDKPPESDWAH